MWETGVQSMGWKDPLEEEMATHSRILAWRIPWTEEPGGLQSMGSHSQTRPSDLARTRLGGWIPLNDQAAAAAWWVDGSM